MKKYYVFGLASALIVPAVSAEVSIYGVAAPSVQYSKITDTPGYDLTRTRLIDNVSRLGFRGSDALDSGVKVKWQVENRFYIGPGEFNTPGGFNTRDTFLGLEGKFGELIAGNSINDLAYQSKVDYLNGLLAFNETVNGVHKSVNQSEGRMVNIARYTSPFFLDGVQVRALYDFGAKTTAANYQGVQASVMYKAKMFKVGATYKQNSDTDTAGNTVTTTVTPMAESFLKSYTLGATVTPIENLDVSAMMVWTKRRNATLLANPEKKQNGWAVGGNYSLGKHGMGVHYGVITDRQDNGVTQADTGAYFLAAQYKYALSKQTFFHASYGLTKNAKNAKYSMGTTKVNYSSSTDPAIKGVNGMKVSTITAGVTTRF